MFTNYAVIVRFSLHCAAAALHILYKAGMNLISLDIPLLALLRRKEMLRCVRSSIVGRLRKVAQSI